MPHTFFNKISLRCFGVALLFLALTCTSGCGNLKDITADWPHEKLYTEAKEELKNGVFDKAIGYFEKLEIRAAGTPLAQQAQIDKAFALYKSNEQARALITLDRFLRLHPSSPLVDYALYLKGLVNFNDNQSALSSWTKQNIAERDQKAFKEAFESFGEVVRRFPQSKYADDARSRMTYIVNALAESELGVARYYFGLGAYLAAANRAQSALTDYPTAPSNEKALEVLIESYDKMGLQQLRDDAKRIMGKTYPSNRLAAK